MFFFCTTRNNGIAYLLWRWVFRNNGEISARLDHHYIGTTQGPNDYNSLAANYTGSNIKPDKQYSILPTVLHLIGECVGKTVVDVGCGGGFFTAPIAKRGATRVYGIDNSEAQLHLATQLSPHPAITYVLSNIFIDPIPAADIVVIPFVANYARTIPILEHLFKQIFVALQQDGKVVFVFDLPNGKNLEKFGAVKQLLGKAQDETPIQIDLCNAGKSICRLNAVFYTPATIERLLEKVGFKNITWHSPIISDDGVDLMEAGFWKDYQSDPELGYLTARK